MNPREIGGGCRCGWGGCGATRGVLLLLSSGCWVSAPVMVVLPFDWLSRQLIGDGMWLILEVAEMGQLWGRALEGAGQGQLGASPCV